MVSHGCRLLMVLVVALVGAYASDYDGDTVVLLDDTAEPAVHKAHSSLNKASALAVKSSKSSTRPVGDESKIVGAFEDQKMVGDLALAPLATNQKDLDASTAKLHASQQALKQYMTVDIPDSVPVPASAEQDTVAPAPAAAAKEAAAEAAQAANVKATAAQTSASAEQEAKLAEDETKAIDATQKAKRADVCAAVALTFAACAASAAASFAAAAGAGATVSCSALAGTGTESGMSTVMYCFNACWLACSFAVLASRSFWLVASGARARSPTFFWSSKAPTIFDSSPTGRVDDLDDFTASADALFRLECALCTAGSAVSSSRTTVSPS